ncbi:MAG: phage tail protein [Cyanobacteria bacterium P01_H01_bin.26]
MSTFTNYTTTPGQRWDSVAYATLNDSYGYQVIIEANQRYRAVIEFSSATVLKIPTVNTATSVNNQLLPPWRR